MRDEMVSREERWAGKEKFPSKVEREEGMFAREDEEKVKGEGFLSYNGGVRARCQILESRVGQRLYPRPRPFFFSYTKKTEMIKEEESLITRLCTYACWLFMYIRCIFIRILNVEKCSTASN